MMKILKVASFMLILFAFSLIGCLASDQAQAQNVAIKPSERNEQFLGKICYRRIRNYLQSRPTENPLTVIPFSIFESLQELGGVDYYEAASAIDSSITQEGPSPYYLEILYNKFIYPFKDKHPELFKQYWAIAENEAKKVTRFESEANLNTMVEGITLDNFLVRKNAFNRFSRIIYDLNLAGELCTYHNIPLSQQREKLETMSVVEAAKDTEFYHSKKLLSIIEKAVIEFLSSQKELQK